MSDEAELSANDVTLNRARLGIEAEAFISSPLGRYLIGRAEEQIDEARLLLDEHNPHDAEGIVALQMKIQVAKRFGQWLGDCIADGRIAEAQIRLGDAELGSGE